MNAHRDSHAPNLPKMAVSVGKITGHIVFGPAPIGLLNPFGEAVHVLAGPLVFSGEKPLGNG